MKEFNAIVTVLVCCFISGCNSPTELSNAVNSTNIVEPVVYKVGRGRIEIKPRQKYELIISLHVLKYAEDHHKLFIPWAKQMRKDLSEKTLHEVTVLIENAHEWQLSSLVEGYDGSDTIDELVEFIKGAGENEVIKRAQLEHLVKKLDLNTKEFSVWYADFLKRYYEEGFRKQWFSKHKKLVYEDAQATAKEFESLVISLTDFMEDFTGRQFKGSSKVILYPSSFSRPQHAYGFSEGGHKVVVYQVGRGKEGVIGSVFHELLHPLIRGWWEEERMKEPISELAKESMFKASWEETGKGSYHYPEYWLDELAVHSVSNYMLYKAGFVSKEWVYQFSSYCNYEKALCEAIFDRYDTFNSINDFLYYAITHIQVSSKGSSPKFVYVDEDGQTPLQPVKGIIGIELANWPTIKVFPKMPAEKAGLRTGDVVIRVNGKDVSHIKTAGDASQSLSGAVGEILRIRVKRNEQILDFDVEIGTISSCIFVPLLSNVLRDSI
jgi:hypothetical protein